jgi:hypothetical protein
MRSKLAISALVVAALFGTMAIASAQTQPAPSAPSEGNAGPDATKSNMKRGTTTGSATKPHTSKGVLPNSPNQRDSDAGTGRGK